MELLFLFEPQTVWERWRYLVENFRLQSGGSFELIKPAFLVLAVFVSAWVLASARKRGLSWWAVALWTAGALLGPQVFAPLYLAFLLWRKPARIKPPHRLAWPALYLAVGLGWLGWGFYLEYQSLDARLARAQQFRLLTWHNSAARELRAALALEESPRTRNLLGQELAAAGRHEEAVTEFRAALQNAEPDELLPLRLGQSLDVINRPQDAAPQYLRFLQSPYCAAGNEEKCQWAQARLEALKK